MVEQPGQIVVSLPLIHAPFETSDAVIIAAVFCEAKSQGLDIDSVVGLQVGGLADAVLGGRLVAMPRLTDAHLIPQGRLLGIHGQPLTIPGQSSLVVSTVLLHLSQPAIGLHALGVGFQGLAIEFARLIQRQFAFRALNGSIDGGLKTEVAKSHAGRWLRISFGEILRFGNLGIGRNGLATHDGFAMSAAQSGAEEQTYPEVDSDRGFWTFHCRPPEPSGRSEAREMAQPAIPTDCNLVFSACPEGRGYPDCLELGNEGGCRLGDEIPSQLDRLSSISANRLDNLQ